MAVRRLIYLFFLALSVVFYIAYGQWLAWMTLVLVLLLPWLSLALSLPAIFRFHIIPVGDAWTELGGENELFLLGSCSLPMPPFRGELRLRRCFTGEVLRYQEPGGIPTDHCGGYVVTAERVRICDYLGLFAFPVRKKKSMTVLVRPRPVEVSAPDGLQRYIARSWKPKPGGYAENHELRLYRPGDSLNQVHWKLSAKTGKLILRQPMEPRRGRVVLTVNLRGTPEVLDRKLGRLLWLGRYILARSIHYEIRALTGNGVQTFPVCTEEDLQCAVDALLCSPLVKEGDLRLHSFAADWLYHVGGEEDAR